MKKFKNFFKAFCEIVIPYMLLVTISGLIIYMLNDFWGWVFTVVLIIVVLSLEVYITYKNNVEYSNDHEPVSTTSVVVIETDICIASADFLALRAESNDEFMAWHNLSLAYQQLRDDYKFVPLALDINALVDAKGKLRNTDEPEQDKASEE